MGKIEKGVVLILNHVDKTVPFKGPFLAYFLDEKQNSDSNFKSLTRRDIIFKQVH